MVFVVWHTNGSVVICLTDIKLLMLIKLNQTCMK